MNKKGSNPPPPHLQQPSTCESLGKYLITTDSWFYAPDGNTYQAVWGEVTILKDDQILGIKTNRNSSDWYVQVGFGEKHTIVAGCQMHYAVKSSNRPSLKGTKNHWSSSAEHGINVYESPNAIWIAE